MCDPVFQKHNVTLEFSNKGVMSKCKESITLMYLSQSKHLWNTQIPMPAVQEGLIFGKSSAKICENN